MFGAVSRPAAAILFAILISACATSAPPPAASLTPAASPTPSVAGMTLDEEVGAVMMVGFRGGLTDAVLQDWTRHQYGGLLVVNQNQNATSAADMTTVIARIRAVSRRRLITATDQEGGGVCLAIGTVPCDAMPVGERDTTAMASQLHALGFDVDLGPVSDVCSGPNSIMWGRCYGTDPATVAGAVPQVVAGIHAAGMLATAKHFPGHGNTSVSSETQLPRIDESLATLRSRDLPPFAAAIAAGADFVMMGHLFYPAIDSQRSTDLSPNTFALLRGELGFKGAIISDDMQMGAITSSTPTPEAAVEFLIAGGDMVMVAHDTSVADAAFDAIKTAVIAGRLPRSRLDAAVSDLQKLTAPR